MKIHSEDCAPAYLIKLSCGRRSTFGLLGWKTRTAPFNTRRSTKDVASKAAPSRNKLPASGTELPPIMHTF